MVKNKVAAPFRDAEFDIMYGQGISREGDLVDLGVEHKLIDKSGAWFSYKGERLGQGRENTKAFLKDHLDIFNEIDVALREILFPKPSAEGAAAGDGAAAAVTGIARSAAGASRAAKASVADDSVVLDVEETPSEE
jgi:recombination protein RecA